MFYREHGMAHVHAVYGEHEISVEVETAAELLENWQLAKQGQPLKRIAPHPAAPDAAGLPDVLYQ